MLSTRWQPVSVDNELHRLQHEVNRLFGLEPQQRAKSAPALNVWEEDGHFVVEAEVPGVKGDDLEVSISDGNHLSVQYERPAPEAEKSRWRKRERLYGAFQRKVELPDDVDAEHVEASVLDGVLTIRLAKRAVSQPRRIDVKTSR